MSKARAFRKTKVTLSSERAFEVVRRPLVTEKSTLGSEYGQVAFEVAIDATKPEIKAAIESLFKVKVKAVNTLRQNGKVKRFKGHLGRRGDVKKAYVSLEEGHSIDVTTGI